MHFTVRIFTYACQKRNIGFIYNLANQTYFKAGTMNRIIKAHLEKFASNHGLEADDESI